MEIIVVIIEVTWPSTTGAHYFVKNPDTFQVSS